MQASWRPMQDKSIKRAGTNKKAFKEAWFPSFDFPHLIPHLIPMTIESDPVSGSTRVAENPASLIHPMQSAPV